MRSTVWSGFWMAFTATLTSTPPRVTYSFDFGRLRGAPSVRSSTATGGFSVRDARIGDGMALGRACREVTHASMLLTSAAATASAKWVDR